MNKTLAGLIIGASFAIASQAYGQVPNDSIPTPSGKVTKIQFFKDFERCIRSGDMNPSYMKSSDTAPYVNSLKNPDMRPLITDGWDEEITDFEEVKDQVCDIYKRFTGRDWDPKIKVKFMPEENFKRYRAVSAKHPCKIMTERNYYPSGWSIRVTGEYCTKQEALLGLVHEASHWSSSAEDHDTNEVQALLFERATGLLMASSQGYDSKKSLGRSLGKIESLYQDTLNKCGYNPSSSTQNKIDAHVKAWNYLNCHP